MSFSYSRSSGSFSDRLSDLFSTVGVGAKVAKIEIWFLILAITVIVIVVTISALIVSAGVWFEAW